MQRVLTMALVCLVVISTNAYSIDLKLPWASGETWTVTVGYDGYCEAVGCPDEYHTDANNGYYALDFDKPGAPDGSGLPILAAASGNVIFAGGDSATGFGYYVKIDHGSGYVTLYGHLKEYPTVSGYVPQGTQIGKLGSTGWSTGDHLHFALYYDGDCLSTESNSKPEPFSDYTNIVYGQSLISNNTGYSYECTYINQTAKGANGYYNLHPGDTMTVWIDYSNSSTPGSPAWTNNGADPDNYVELKSCDSDGDTPNNGWLYYDVSPKNWINSSRVTSMNQSSVGVGDTARFEFVIEVPSNASTGLYDDNYFRIIHATGDAIGDWAGVNFPVNVIVDPDPYDAHSVAMVSGDFDNDGVVNDLASIYDYENSECRIHAWLSDGTEFDYQGATGWWNVTSGYPSENVRHAVAGDFDGDGYKDDIAALYDYDVVVSPNYRSCWHVWLGTGSSFVYQGVGQGWWIADGYNANSVIDAVSGDFDEDGVDDIATIYDYPLDTCAIHVWLSTGSSFIYQGSQGWYYLASGYPSQNVKFMVSGDWDNDGDDDLATFYDYGLVGSKYRTRIHTFLSNGSSFIYQGAGGWWTYDGYNMDDVVQAVSGDFDNDGKTDLATFYDYGWISSVSNYLTKIHVWLSTGSAFSFQNIWWSSYGYNAQNVKFALPGYFNSGSNMDVMSAYDYNDGDTTRYHVWLSSGSAFTYQGGGGWWSSTGFVLPKLIEGETIAGVLPSFFILNQNYPNPFNPMTTISYTLPSAIHVRLDIFNILGQNVQTLVDKHQTAGEHTVLWNSGQFSSGVYFYRMQTGEAIETKKMMLLK